MKSRSFSVDEHAKWIKAVKESTQLQKMQNQKSVPKAFRNATKQMKLEQRKSFANSFFNFLDDTSHFVFALILVAVIIIISVIIYYISQIKNPNMDKSIS